MKNNQDNHNELTIDSFKLYESSEDGKSKDINGKKYINDFELYQENIEE